MNVAPPQAVVDFLTDPAKLAFQVIVAIGILILFYGVAKLASSRSAQPAGNVRSRSRLAATGGNWQLMLLATTGFVLSLASGYTTWKGMTNFTGEPVLAAMVTFGIQGVMLIVAWLIGESFATGMNRQLPDGRPASRLDAVIGMLLAFAVIAGVFVWLLYSYGAVDLSGVRQTNWARFADVSAYFALALIVLGVLAFNFRRGGELSMPYVQSTRVMVKNAVLWVMFLACMATSVFFSYDALFTVIFPNEERARAAQLRAQNQVAGIVADIGSTIERRRLEEMGRLFEKPGWQRYDANLTKLYVESENAEQAIEDHFTRQMEARRKAIDEQQNRIATAKSGAAGLRTKKISLTEELSRLKSERPELATDLAAKKSELDTRARGVDAKRVEAQAEAGGAEGTGKVGRGPMYRQRMDELRQLEAAYKIQEKRVADAQARIAAVNSRIARSEAELAQIDSEIAKYNSESQTAETRIKMAEDQNAGNELPRIDPARVRQSFEKARTEFRQNPSVDRLAALQQQCSDLRGALAATDATKDRVRGIDCDPKQAAEASGVMFALNAGMATYGAACAGGDKIDQHKTTDALWGFARKCLADSGLPSRETDQLRGKINHAELSRDDRAHPFVATLNAFNDGNKLAYLALGIAVAMDLLVFMSGLFGANAMRSPLSDVPSTRARSGRQLEAIIENALLPDSFESARAVLNAMNPMTPHDGFTARVTIDPADPHAADVRRVLNAAATIGAVRHAPGTAPVYEVRAELFEFLSLVAKRSFEADDENARLAELRKVTTVALQPHVGDHADIVLHHCRPITESKGFSAEVLLAELGADDGYVVQRVLNAGATLNYVQRDEDREMAPLQRYYVHKQLYKTLLMISSAYPRTGMRSHAPAIGVPDGRGGPRLGGQMRPVQHQLPGVHEETRRLPEPDPEFVAAIGSAAGGGAQQAGSAPGTVRQSEGEPYTSRDLQQWFTVGMVEAVGGDPIAYEDIAGDTFGAALSAADAFKRLQASNQMFNEQVDEREREAQLKVDQVRDRLASLPDAQTPQGADALRNAHDDVLRNLTIIGLLPGGFIEVMMKGMVQLLEAQHAEDNLSPDEQELLRLAKRLHQRLTASARSNPNDWRMIEADLARDHAMSGQLAVFAQSPGKRALN